MGVREGVGRVVVGFMGRRGGRAVGRVVVGRWLFVYLIIVVGG